MPHESFILYWTESAVELRCLVSSFFCAWINIKEWCKVEGINVNQGQKEIFDNKIEMVEHCPYMLKSGFQFINLLIYLFSMKCFVFVCLFFFHLCLFFSIDKMTKMYFCCWLNVTFKFLHVFGVIYRQTV